MYTTLNELRKHRPCHTGGAKLLKYLGKTTPDDEPLSYITILESNGIEDAIWCLRVLPDYDLKVMEFKLKCARRVEHLDKSGIATATLNVVESYIGGYATEENLQDAATTASAAVSAAYDAAYAAAAYVAAYVADAARNASARNAAYATARNAASAAAASAAASAAYAADAYDAAYDSELGYQTKIFREIFRND